MDTKLKYAFLHSDEIEKFSYPEESPFKTERAGKTKKILSSMGLLGGADVALVPPVAASLEDMRMLHSPEYLEVLQKVDQGHFQVEYLSLGLGTGDCPVFQGLWPYAELAVGASLTGARLLLKGEMVMAFNPSGGYHHAHRDQASGFCYVNDVALACELLTRAGKRVFYLDVDVHHGDGVQDFFYERDDVFTISLHESGRTLFPGTGFEDELGRGPGLGYAANLPLPVGTHDDAYRKAFFALVPPLLKAYEPDVLVVELGMDALAGDPLAHLSLTNNVYADICQWLAGLGKPILATGGGGYHAENASRGWALCFSILSGQDDPNADLSAGLGGVMLQSTEWQGGLRDRATFGHGDNDNLIKAEIQTSLEKLKNSLFSIHGIHS